MRYATIPRTRGGMPALFSRFVSGAGLIGLCVFGLPRWAGGGESSALNLQQNSLSGKEATAQAGPLISKVGVLDAKTRHVILAGLDVFLRDDYRGPLPILVEAECFGRPATPSLAIDVNVYGADARLLNLTSWPEHGCSSYQINVAEVSGQTVVQGAAGIGAAPPAAVITGIAISVHYFGPRSADGPVNEPAVFVFNPVQGNWTEAKSFKPAVQEPQRAYATLSEHHQRIIGGVIALPDPLQADPATNSPSSLARPLEAVSPLDGYLAIDRIEPDSKGAYSVNLPLLLRPSRGPGPSFSIRYSSQGAPGVLGRGWDLLVSTIEVRG